MAEQLGPAKPPRHAPANRRPGCTYKLTVDGVTAHATINFYGDGRPSELFLAGPKPGSPLASTLEDVAVIVSIALQHGIPPAALAKSIARHEETGAPATLIGAALDLLVRLTPDAAQDRAAAGGVEIWLTGSPNTGLLGRAVIGTRRGIGASSSIASTALSTTSAATRARYGMRTGVSGSI